MKNFKIVAWILAIAVLYFSGALQQVASFGQSVVIQSGIVNAKAASNNDSPFDYNFIVKDLAGNKIDFKDFKGKVIFLNLWATWCGPCRSEMASIQKLFDGISKDNISFVMLSLDQDRQFENVKKYIRGKEFTFPVYMPSGYLAEQLQVPSIPTTFVISKDGIIALKEVGMKNYNTAKFKKYLEELAAR